MSNLKNGKIKFSIVVPVYQVEKYVDECIQSVLAQTYSNWELILVDDGTKDRSGEICDCYAAQDGRIHVYHKENGGQLQTRLYGIARATGDYYVFLDSDDTLKYYALQTINENLQKYNCDCLIFGYERFRGNEIVEKSMYEKGCCLTDKRELYRKCLLGHYNGLSRKVVRASIFQYGEAEYAPYFHIRLGEDLLHSLEVFKNSKSIVFIDDRLYNYRLNPESVMETATYEEYDHIDYTVWEMVWNFLDEEKVFQEEDMIEYRGRCIWPITADICRISSADISLENKKRLFKEIRISEYYQRLMEGQYDKKHMGLAGQFLFPLFVKGHDRILMFIAGFAWRHLRNVRRRIKKLLGK